MCGRFTRSHDFTEHANQRTFLDQLGLAFAAPLPTNYNVAPTQQIAAVRSNKQDGRELVMLRWGLVPGWAPDLAIGSRMINAQAETVAEKPAYRNALKKRRCLIVADGFYEWQKIGKAKQPYLIRLKGGTPFCFARLWERWTRGEKAG
jgi:putative SOS response-associated peptidase YedK